MKGSDDQGKQLFCVDLSGIAMGFCIKHVEKRLIEPCESTILDRRIILYALKKRSSNEGFPPFMSFEKYLSFQREGYKL